jgi:hypothetical protein
MRILTVALLLLTALAAAPRARADDNFPSGCATTVGYGLLAEPRLARQGDTVAVKAVKVGPWGLVGELPTRCASRWKVSDPALASLKGGALTIAADAPAGTMLEITAEVAGKPVSLKLRIEPKAGPSLVGFWTEVGAPDCPISDPPLRELAFKGDGTFTVTWTPFESFVNYGGEYQFDPASGVLKMTGRSINSMPADTDLEGTATINPEGLLDLRGVFFGTPYDGKSGPLACGLRFKKQS